MRRLLSPRWLVAHLFVLAVVAVCVSLGSWQLRRLDERRAVNARIEDQRARPMTSLDAPAGDGSRLVYRTVEIRGAYDADREVLLAGRALNGRPGHHVLTPLRTDQGWGVVVERGWVPYELDRPPVAAAAPPSGPVRVEGVVLRSEEAGGGVGSGAVLRRPDVGLIRAGVPYPIHPFYVRLTEQAPPQDGELPVAVAQPEVTEGPHLGYAVQWFLFAATGAGVYAALAWRDVRRQRAPSS